MHVLLVKTSSMGDVIHTLPALSDAQQAMPHIKFDWVVEGAFKMIPAWHPAVHKVIPVALRRWRKKPFAKNTRVEWAQWRQQLQPHYDLVLDAQGLVKSAFLTLFTSGQRAGLNRSSAREALASLVYHQQHEVNFQQHAVVRMRQLFSLALGYPLPHTTPDFGLSKAQFQLSTSNAPYIVFLCGTTWTSKQWPEAYWGRLAEMAGQAGYKIKISGYQAEELALAERISQYHSCVEVIPNLNISEMANLLASAQGAIAVDTGLGHLAAALNIPTVSIYGATNPDFTGAVGTISRHLAAQFGCSPCLSRECHYRKTAEVTPACYATVSPAQVWAAISEIIPHTHQQYSLYCNR
jgi:heptosyltransferase-1